MMPTNPPIPDWVKIVIDIINTEKLMKENK
jgi:hypothetical protein